jgi:hypothetical protein
MSEIEDYVVTTPAIDILSELFVNVIKTERDEFANGRFVRNIFETMVMNHARRIVNFDSPSLKELKELTDKDIPPFI